MKNYKTMSDLSDLKEFDLIEIQTKKTKFIHYVVKYYTDTKALSCITLKYSLILIENNKQSRGSQARLSWCKAPSVLDWSKAQEHLELVEKTR